MKVVRDICDWLDFLNIKRGPNVPRGSTYILPNGEFADLTGAGLRTHGSLDELLKKHGFVNNKDLSYHIPIEFFNCIRCNDGLNISWERVIDLPANPINAEQLESIETYLNAVYSASKPFISVGSTVLRSPFQRYDLNELEPYQIAKRIKGFYKTGILHENEE